jgi:uncharacterized protein (DUF1800 family)
MGIFDFQGARSLVLMAVTALLLGCGGGGGSGSASSAPGPAPSPPPTTPPEPEPEPEPEPLTEAEAARFLSQSTFGPDNDSIKALVSQGLEDWLLTELEKPPSLHLPAVLSGFPADGRFVDGNGNPLPGVVSLASDSFWKTAIEADDQLRQRLAYALSQILVVSSSSNLFRAPQAVAHYMDILTEGAFGNYRDLLQAVTYSPAMAVYLTYLRNEKADLTTGRVPDENYARELLQLFTVGLVKLSPDGTPVTTQGGAQVELYDNTDITELAKVFTGLSFQGAGFAAPLQRLPAESFHSPLAMFDAYHSMEPKRFMGVQIPADTNGEKSIDMALDGIFQHPNLGPFLGRQLIQRFVTSAPEPGYVARVAAAFDEGRYELPSGTVLGSGKRGDLRAVIAAVLFDVEARDVEARQKTSFGKLREPILRFTHWARAFEVNSANASNERVLRDTSSFELLGQHPYRSPSVFNFYRPGYIAPGTETGAAGLTAPELQISNASSVVGYPNFLTAFALSRTPLLDPGQPRAFVADYSEAAALAEEATRLLDYLDQLLTHGTLRPDTRQRIGEVIDALPANTAEDLELRARIASVLVMTASEYVVLR